MTENNDALERMFNRHGGRIRTQFHIDGWSNAVIIIDEDGGELSLRVPHQANNGYPKISNTHFLDWVEKLKNQLKFFETTFEEIKEKEHAARQG